MDEKILKRMEALGLKPSGDAAVSMKFTGALVPIVPLNKGGYRGLSGQLDKESLFAPRTRGELLPEEGDFIYPVFRALSKTIIPGYWTDYTTGDVLKKSAPMLERQTVYPNHDQDVTAWIGAVEKAWWDDSSEVGSGVPGINVRMKIDWKTNPKIARGLLMEPPAIHSCSVTVTFAWKKSHPDLDGWKFWEMLGEEVDGRRVLIEVAEILGYDEISLVYQGADPGAKIVEISNASAGTPALDNNLNKEAGTDSHAAVGRDPADSGQHTPAADAATPLDRGYLSTKGDPTMEALLIKLQEQLKAATPEEALKAALSRLEAAGRLEPYFAVAIELQKTGLTPEGAAEAIRAGQSYRKKLEEDLATYAKLALRDPESENDTLPEGLVESLCSQDLEKLEKTVEYYADRARKKFAGRSSQAATVDDGDGNGRPPEVDASKVHG